jgi:hypothetical protein
MTRAMFSLLDYCTDYRTDYCIAVAPVELTGQSLDLFAHYSAANAYAIV